MPITLSMMPAINAAITAQNTALSTVINAARDNVKADNVTQVTNQSTTLTTAINAARDNVKADTLVQRNAINTNTDTRTAAVTTAVNAKGAVKSVQRVSIAAASTAVIATVDIAKTMVFANSWRQRYGGGTMFTQVQGVRLDSATQVSNPNATDLVDATIVEFW